MHLFNKKSIVRLFLCLLLCSLKNTVMSQDNPWHAPPDVTYVTTSTTISKDVLFFLYTRANPNGSELFINNEHRLYKTTFDIGRPTKFVTHGWRNDGMRPSVITVKDGFLIHGTYNVIIVDWGAIANNVNYAYPASYVKLVGLYVSKMIDFLVNQGNDPLEMSLVGHSLGAHVMGLAGQQAHHKVGHIVGLDPAGPSFLLKPENDRLSSDDAKQVEVVHTNSGILGFMQPIGHIDYYPNHGGPNQPGCGVDPTCSHSRAYLYYAESLERPKHWYGIACNNYGTFVSGRCYGNAITPFPRWAANFTKLDSTYMLRTRDFPPFGIGYTGVTSPLTGD